MRITQFSKPLKDFNNQPLVIKQENQQIVFFTIKTAILNCLGAKKAISGQESIGIYKLGIRLFDIEETQIDANELLLLKIAVEENAPGYTSIIQAQLLLFLEEVESS